MIRSSCYKISLKLNSYEQQYKVPTEYKDAGKLAKRIYLKQNTLQARPKCNSTIHLTTVLRRYTR